MAECRLEHVHNCSVESFWKVFLDEKYQAALFASMDFPRFEQTRFDEHENEIQRVIRVTPKVVGVPGPLKKVVGEGFSYEEHGTFDKKRQRFRFKIRTSKLADKINITGIIYCLPAGDGKSKRIFEATVQAKVFGVGKLLEKQIIHDMDRDYRTGAAFTNDYLKQQGLAAE